MRQIVRFELIPSRAFGVDESQHDGASYRVDCQLLEQCIALVQTGNSEAIFRSRAYETLVFGFSHNETQAQHTGDPYRDENAQQQAGQTGALVAQIVVVVFPPMIAALAAVGGAWVNAKQGRKIKVKVGDNEIETQTIEQLEQAMRTVIRIQQVEARLAEKARKQEE